MFASLSSSKGRKEHSLFLVQGTKCVIDTVDSFEVEAILATNQWINEHLEIADKYEITVVKKADLDRITTLSTSPEVIAICRIPKQESFSIKKDSLVLALDGIQDPGNLGTIIRVADWMGVNKILASQDTVDTWNPKVVQASMGAISRIHVLYVPLFDTLSEIIDLPIYGTFLDGDNIYSSSLSQGGIVVMGNEGNGISRDVAKLVNQRLFIPSFPPDRKTSESLNVAIATSITLSEFRRRQFG